MLVALHVPYALALSILVGVLDLIPLVGSTVGGVIVALAAVSTTAALITVAYHVLYRVFEDYLLNPRVLRRTVDVSPLVTVVAVLLGGSLLGVTNALIAVPAAAAVQLLLTEVLYPQRDTASAPTGPHQPTRHTHRPAPGLTQAQRTRHSEPATIPTASPGQPGLGGTESGHSNPARKEKHMSGIDKAKDKGQELGGKAKETAGDATGNDDLKAE